MYKRKSDIILEFDRMLTCALLEFNRMLTCALRI